MLLSALLSAPCFLHNMIFFAFVTTVEDLEGIFMEISTFALLTEESKSIKEVTACSCTTALEV